MVIREKSVYKEEVTTCNVLCVLQEKALDNEHLAKLYGYIMDVTKDAETFQGCSAKDRALLHQYADELELEHFSSGPKSERILTLSKNSNFDLTKLALQIREQYFYDGYIGLRGPLVCWAGRRGIDAVPESYIQNRIARDGTDSHITIISRKELKQITPKGAQSFVKGILKEMNESLPDSWEDLGLGRVEEVYFKVLEWEEANHFRRRYNLPKKDFHITVGYLTNDIHDCEKGISTLIK